MAQSLKELHMQVLSWKSKSGLECIEATTCVKTSNIVVYKRWNQTESQWNQGD